MGLFGSPKNMQNSGKKKGKISYFCQKKKKKVKNNGISYLKTKLSKREIILDTFFFL